MTVKVLLEMDASMPDQKHCVPSVIQFYTFEGTKKMLLWFYWG